MKYWQERFLAMTWFVHVEIDCMANCTIYTCPCLSKLRLRAKAVVEITKPDLLFFFSYSSSISISVSAPFFPVVNNRRRRLSQNPILTLQKHCRSIDREYCSTVFILCLQEEKKISPLCTRLIYVVLWRSARYMTLCVWRLCFNLSHLDLVCSCACLF